MRVCYLCEAPLWALPRVFFFMRLSICARVVSFMARTASARTRKGRVVQFEPVVLRGHIDVAEANLLGWQLELSSAVGSLALLNQALFV